MLYGQSIVDMGGNGVAFMNSYGLSEMIGLMDSIIQHMAEDLEYATGIPKDIMIDNYIYISMASILSERWQRSMETGMKIWTRAWFRS